MFTTKAIQIEQNGRIFYVAAIPAGQLVEMSKVDEWKPDDPMLGYQRAPSMARKREIGRYTMGSDAIMPIGGLLNSRPQNEDEENVYGKQLQFIEESNVGGIKFGELTIPEKALPLYIVDMQHRLGGFQWAIEEGGGENLSEFPLVVTIADGLSKLDEVEQFDLINTTQKKVRTDLARRLLAIQVKDLDRKLAIDKKGKLWEAKGPMIAQHLNNSPGVWESRILPPNLSKRDQPTMIVRETSFVTSLKPILQTPYFLRQTEEHASILIGRFWEAIERVFPESFIKTEDYVIQKTPGVYSLHTIAPEVFELVRDTGDINAENIYNVLGGLGEVEGGSDFWLSDNYDGAAQYGSMKGFKILASELRMFLPEIEVI